MLDAPEQAVNNGLCDRPHPGQGRMAVSEELCAKCKAWKSKVPLP